MTVDPDQLRRDLAAGANWYEGARIIAERAANNPNPEVRPTEVLSVHQSSGRSTPSPRNSQRRAFWRFARRRSI